MCVCVTCKSRCVQCTKTHIHTHTHTHVHVMNLRCVCAEYVLKCKCVYARPASRAVLYTLTHTHTHAYTHTHTHTNYRLCILPPSFPSSPSLSLSLSLPPCVRSLCLSRILHFAPYEYRSLLQKRPIKETITERALSVSCCVLRPAPFFLFR